MHRAVIGLERLSAGLNSLALWGAVTAVIVMTFAAGYQVVARYVFDAPPIWTEEFARRAMVWAGMLGASIAFYQRSDPNLFPHLADTGGVLGKAMALLRFAGVAVFALPVLYYSLFGPNWNMARGFIGRNLDRTAEMMGISMAWFAVAVPAGFALILVHALAGVAVHLWGTAGAKAEHHEEIVA